MNRLLLPSLFLVSALSLHAATVVNLSGKVTDTSGKPVAGAVVTVAGLKMSDTTGSTGEYAISTATAVRVAPAARTSNDVTFSNGSIGLVLADASVVTIDLFDMKGSLIKRVLMQSVSAGKYHYNVLSDLVAPRMMAIRVSVDGTVSTFKYIPFGKQQSVITRIHEGSRGGASDVVAKLMATVDTLKVTASGYSAKTVALSSFQTTVDVTLSDAVVTNLDKFSFFVTSMKALQDLSGSELGFGGDFRFGKTGDGAGLLGADSICSCIAERSMEGSSAKKWRAFLSVSKGPDGTQVNAIDRIGEGPWYDRLGRIVSNTKAELLNERPAGAHSAIKNDLPNEDGVPNHQPDPNQPIVDNHMTVTGSGTTGELYVATGSSGSFGGFGTSGQTSENPTCNDWTSTTASSRPRVGLSWPQSTTMKGGAKNWLSMFDASGCEAGIDLDESTMAGKPGIYTIGNGGGYGGFYCFALTP